MISGLGDLAPIPGDFSLGVCYYPEQWPRDRWEPYAARMRELGITFVRIGEFAWSRIEPSPGDFCWAWLDDAIDVLMRAGLRVVMCTPTAAPPAWLVRAHPDILPVDADGRVRNFGARRHYDFSNQVYRRECERITRAVAGRYGDHLAVAGWQIDNEFGDHETGLSYSTSSTAAFRAWLIRRYGTIDSLNEAWGAIFWSQEYSCWEEIDPPNLTVAPPNPSHMLDYRRFSSDKVAEFLELQVGVLRELSPGRWITHNYMRLCPEFDHYRNARELDFVTWDAYPSGAVEYSPFTEDEKNRWARTGHPDLIAFNHDLYRCMHDRRAHWVMEGQVGHINWAPSNTLPASGTTALWTAQAYAHGASCMSFFRWRAATAAQEMMHSGLLRHDESLDRGGEELRDLAFLGLVIRPGRSPVALLHDYDSLWIYDEQPHSQHARYWDQVMLFYTALRSLGIDIDVVHADFDLSSYRFIVAPALQIVDEARARTLTGAARDAFIIAGPRTGFRNSSGRVHDDGQPGPLRPLLGYSLLNFDGLRPGLSVHAGGHHVHTWAESYRPIGAKVLVTYDDGPLAGQAAVVRNGNAFTIGAWSDSLIRTILEQALHEAGIETTQMPEGVRRSRQNGHEIWLNFNQFDVSVDNGRSIPPVSYLILADRRPQSGA